MQINHLAFVLEYIDTSVHDTDLLTAYERLLAALALFETDRAQAAAAVQPARERLHDQLQRLEPTGWDGARTAIWRTYGAAALLGDAAAERLDQIFVENFMLPERVVAAVLAMHTETQALALRVSELLTGLDPLLTAAPTTELDVVHGEMVSTALVRPQQGMLQGLRNRLPLVGRRGTQIVRSGEAPLANKVLAAAPIILAAAGKALELYLSHQEKEKQQPQQQPVARSAPPAAYYPPAQQNGRVVTSYSRSYYRRTVTIIERDR